jgi:hypothetical protein
VIHAQNADASSQETPTAGRRGPRKWGSLHQGGAGTTPAAIAGAYSAFVTGVRARKKADVPPSFGIGTAASADATPSPAIILRPCAAARASTLGIAARDALSTSGTSSTGRDYTGRVTSRRIARAARAL